VQFSVCARIAGLNGSQSAESISKMRTTKVRDGQVNDRTTAQISSGNTENSLNGSSRGHCMYFSASKMH